MSTSKVAYLFPGQGSQSIGMGRDLSENFPAAKAMMEKADAALGQSISWLCFEGPEEILRQTANTQPALLAVSIAALAAAGDRLPRPVAVAGHSLGEYSALVAAGALSFEEGLRLVRTRGEAMEAAAAAIPGAMAAIIGLGADEVARACASAGASVANFNAPGQIVISGSAEAVARAGEAAKAAGAKRALPLNVSGAFHSPLMAPAAELMKKVLAEATISTAGIPVVANISAEFVREPEEIRKALTEQITGSVQWIRSIEKLVAEGVDTFIEIGPGQVLTGLVKRINPEVRTLNIQDSASLAATLAALG